MYKLALLFTLLTLVITSGIARTGEASQVQDNPIHSSNGTAVGPIRGCLTRRGAGYSLIQNRTGTVFLLAGDTASLKGYEGQQIEVVGDRSLEGSPQADDAAGAGQKPVYSLEMRNTKILGPCGKEFRAAIAADDDKTASSEIATQVEQMKQRATSLSLVGLIGLGSLLAAFIMRR